MRLPYRITKQASIIQKKEVSVLNRSIKIRTKTHLCPPVNIASTGRWNVKAKGLIRKPVFVNGTNTLLREAQDRRILERLRISPISPLSISDYPP